jgi:phosphohistidine swiveling domain-containing protein
MMKRIILASLIALTTAGAVSAASAPTTLSSAAKSEAQNILPAASFDNLTVDQAARIEGVLTGGKDLTDTDVKLIITKALAS